MKGMAARTWIKKVNSQEITVQSTTPGNPRGCRRRQWPERKDKKSPFENVVTSPWGWCTLPRLSLPCRGEKWIAGQPFWISERWISWRDTCNRIVHQRRRFWPSLIQELGGKVRSCRVAESLTPSHRRTTGSWSLLNSGPLPLPAPSSSSFALCSKLSRSATLGFGLGAVTVWLYAVNSKW